MKYKAPIMCLSCGRHTFDRRRRECSRCGWTNKIEVADLVWNWLIPIGIVLFGLALAGWLWGFEK